MYLGVNPVGITILLLLELGSLTVDLIWLGKTLKLGWRMSVLHVFSGLFSVSFLIMERRIWLVHLDSSNWVTIVPYQVLFTFQIIIELKCP